MHFLLLFILLATQVLWGETKVPPGFEKVDVVINLGTRKGDIRFDKEVLEVKPGQKIKIIFKNTDEMAHNIVFCKKGTDTKKIGELALKMGEEGIKKGYVPESDKILWSMPMILPGKTGEMYFKAPDKPVMLPYVCTLPGHYLKMVGMLYVGMKPMKHKKKPANDYEVIPTGEPYIYRTGLHIPGIGRVPKAITVGFPSGIHYAFDADRCILVAAWKGKFIDAKGDWNGRGGKGAKVLGQLIYKNKDHFPLSSLKGQPQYKGYRLYKNEQIFLYTMGATMIRVRFKLENGKLIQRFMVRNMNSLTYKKAKDQPVTPLKGTFKDDVLVSSNQILGLLLFDLEIGK